MRLLTALLLTAVTASPGPGSGTSTVRLAERDSPVPVVALPGDPRGFSTYDFRQQELGDVDWPVAFVFRGSVTVQDVKEALCERTTHAWKYCDSGGPMYLFDAPVARSGPSSGFRADRGVKRFNENCSTTRFSGHIRLYPVGDTDGGPSGAARVVGTVHLDFGDKGGCTGRIHGYPDVARAWFLQALQSVPGWQVTPDAWNLHNGSEPYVVQRVVAGVEVPHVYGQGNLATDVYVP